MHPIQYIFSSHGFKSFAIDILMQHTLQLACDLILISFINILIDYTQQAADGLLLRHFYCYLSRFCIFITMLCNLKKGEKKFIKL